jgi:hypothetical protein
MALALARIGTHANGFLTIDGSSGELPIGAEFVMLRIPV